MSVEDVSKCKRPISVPGVVVNVRRVVVSDKLNFIIIGPNLILTNSQLFNFMARTKNDMLL